MTQSPIAAALEAKVTELGTANAAAKYFNISPAYLSQIRNGHKPIPEWVGIALGYRLMWQKMENVG